jgi:hypothetical protein
MDKKNIGFRISPTETVIHYNFPQGMTDEQKSQWCNALAEMILATKPSELRRDRM